MRETDKQQLALDVYGAISIQGQLAHDMLIIGQINEDEYMAIVERLYGRSNVLEIIDSNITGASVSLTHSLVTLNCKLPSP